MNPNPINEDIRLNEINEANYEDSYVVPPPPMAGPVQKADPDNPPWGLGIGILTWFASASLLFLFQALFLVGYIVVNQAKGIAINAEGLASSPIAVLLLVLSIIPAHIATIWFVWIVVTGWGHRPFREMLGWAWGKNFRFWASVGLAIGLLIIGIVITQFLGGSETDIDRIVKASLPARFTLAFIAAFTAPLTEELVYRGVLYAGLRRTFSRWGDSFGTILSVIFVSFLFAVVHFPQYWGNYGVLIVIMYLSIALTVLRAKTGKILPCVIVHFIFNGIQAVGIVAEPYLQKYISEPKTQQSFIILKNLIHLFF